MSGAASALAAGNAGGEGQQQTGTEVQQQTGAAPAAPVVEKPWHETAGIDAQYGPAIMIEKSRTRTPVSASPCTEAAVIFGA